MPDSGARGDYVFGDYRLDAGARLLRCGDEVVPLTPKALRVLLALARNAGNVVDKQALLEEVWPNTFVEEGILTYNISALRRAIDHGIKIQTLPKRGYRLMSEVRFVAAAEMAPAALDRAAPDWPGDTAAVPVARFGTRRLPSWAAIASAGAMVVAAVFVAVRPSPPPGLTDRDTVLLADWTNETGEAVFDGTLRQGLAVQLQQSPFLAICADTRVRRSLVLMGHSPDTRVTPDLGLEICERQGLKAVISGTIAKLGGHFVITLQAQGALGGEVLAREQEEVRTREQVLTALSTASARLRRRLGESLGSVRRFDAPLDLTTSSLGALRSFSLGAEKANQGHLAEAVLFYRRAIEQDPNFAFAYAALAAQYSNNRQPDLAAECAAKAFALRDRVTEYEKLRITSYYYVLVTGQVDHAIETLTLWQGLYPREYNARNNLAGEYRVLGQYERALEKAREAQELNPALSTAYANAGLALIRLNRFDEARRVLEGAVQNQLDGSALHQALFQLAMITGDPAGLQRERAWSVGSPEEYQSIDLEGQAAACDGRWQEAESLSQRAIGLAQEAHNAEVAARYSAESAMRAAVLWEFQQVPAAARKAAQQANRPASGRTVGGRVALALALVGDAEHAKAVLTQARRRLPDDTVLQGLWVPLVRGVLAWRAGNLQVADVQMRLARDYDDAGFWPHFLRGQILLSLGRGQAAGAEFHWVLDHRGRAPLSFLFPLAHLGLARSLVVAEDADRSRTEYEAFLSLWTPADRDLPVLRHARAEYTRLK
jgi:eukaryotic-like serine/threonine-protein kinase